MSVITVINDPCLQSEVLNSVANTCKQKKKVKSFLFYICLYNKKLRNIIWKVGMDWLSGIKLSMNITLRICMGDMLVEKKATILHSKYL